MDKPLVHAETVDGIAFLTLNHPEKRNALSRALLTALKEHLDQLAADRKVRVMILRAEGPAFSAGHDDPSARVRVTVGPYVVNKRGSWSS